MVVQKKVTTIPATLTRFTATPINQQKKRRVAGYARVSTDHDDQFTSYAAQVDGPMSILWTQKVESLC